MWYGSTALPTKKRISPFAAFNHPGYVLLSKPLVTVLKRTSAKTNDMWVSFTQVLGSDENNQSIKVWVLSNSLKLVKSSEQPVE